MKKILLLVLLPFFLVSCGEESAENVNLAKFEGQGFVMQTPKSWVKVEGQNLPRPKYGTVVAALTSTDISSGFANNLLVLKDKLSDTSDPAMTSRKYAIVNNAITSGAYKAYTKLGDTTFSFPDGDEGLITTFEAKYTDATPIQKFLQTSKLCGKDVYLMTIGLANSTADTKKYEDILKSFECAK